MTQRFGKLPKYLGHGLATWDTALVFEMALLCWKWLRDLTWLSYMGHGFSI